MQEFDREKQFAENTALAGAFERVKLLMEGKERGQIVKYTELVDASGIPYDRTESSLWDQMTVKLKKWMVEYRGIELVNHREDGYRLATGAEQVGELREAGLAKVRSRLYRQLKLARAVPNAELNTNEQRKRINYVDTVGQHIRELDRSKRSIFDPKAYAEQRMPLRPVMTTEPN